MHPPTDRGAASRHVRLLAILPTYVSALLPGAQSFVVIRTLRLLRVFRIFKLARFLGEAEVLASAVRRGRHKITVFLGTVLILVTILGTAMYLIEGEAHGFSSIPRSVYWAIVTMTTVGYGDIVPETLAGQILSSLIRILGYSILAGPTGIVTAEIVDAAAARRAGITTRVCVRCLHDGHEPRAKFCKDCGAQLPLYEPGSA